nr:reverse transcriptase domain-containing protein [Tanacetum cinerariifolium]
MKDINSPAKEYGLNRLPKLGKKQRRPEGPLPSAKKGYAAVMTLKKKSVTKWAIELGEHVIVFLERDVRETPANFLPEIPIDDSEKRVKEMEVSDPSNEWKLYTDRAFSFDVAGAGLMLINPAVNEKYPEQMVIIGKQLPDHFQKYLRNLLRANAEIFPWTDANMTGIPRAIMVDGKPFKTEHKLNEYSHIKPIKQNKRSLGSDRNAAACKEVEELTKARILRKVKNQTWVANPFMVKNNDGGWRIKKSSKILSISYDNGSHSEKRVKEMEVSDLSNKWKLYTDRAFSFDVVGAGLMLINPAAPPKTDKIIKEIHEGSCGFTAEPRSMVVRITKQGYYWLSMNKEAAKTIQDRDKCKEQSAIRKARMDGAITVRSMWPFSHWGIHILGPLPMVPGGLQVLAIAVEHSTKWVEAKHITVKNARQVE